MPPIINCDELKTWIDEQRNFVLIDTALGENFAEEHLPGAQNACVFEVNFLDQVYGLRWLIIDRANASSSGNGMRRDVIVVVYGASENSFASFTATEKLRAAGFSTVVDFRSGLAGWKAAGLPVEGSGSALKSAPLEDRVYSIDPEQSTIEWIGRSLGGRHYGTLKFLSGGAITLHAGHAVEGRFCIDMTSIDNIDLDPLLKKVLLDHLKSDDFFDVKKFPQALFQLENAEEIPDASQGKANYFITGVFTLKGVVKPLSFDAQIGRSPEGDGGLVARANFDLDRTQWNVLYGSGKFYENLGKHLVSDLITVDLKIVAR